MMFSLFKRQLLSVLGFVILYLVVVGIFYIHNPQDSAPRYHAQEAPVSSTHASELTDLNSITLRVKPGDTLINMLVKLGIDQADSFSAIEALKKNYNPGDLTIGQDISVSFYSKSSGDKHTILNSLIIVESAQTKHVVQRSGENTFIASKIVEPTVKQTIHIVTDIQDSLFNTGTTAGIPVNVLMEIIKSYSYDIDFQRDIKPGDKLELLFERHYTESGEWVRDGTVLYSSLTLSDRSNTPLSYYWYASKSHGTGFFSEKGFSIRKALLRTPINGARISSGFGLRKHPILGYSKMHKGVDFAAPQGTPIYAAGDGKIVKIGRNGGYGNYIQIKHSGDISTAYAHISRFAKGAKHGSRVKQGQVIAYVGTTGRSTGPHLHFELLKQGRQMDPKTVKSIPQLRLPGQELLAFNKNKAAVNSMLASMPTQTRLADASAPTPLTSGSTTQQ